MTDLPIEQEQHRNHLVGFKGSVLVGGLGLGVMAALLAKKRDVRHITIVEKSSDVLRLVGSHVPRKAEVVEADLFEYLKTTRDRFHYAFYDIWASDSEYTFHNMVVPLRQLSTGIVDNNRIVCWNENVMRGQLYFALLSRIQLPTFGTALPHSTRYPSYEEQARAEGDIWVTWCRPFFQKALLEKWNYDRMMEKVVDYVRIYGYPQWEEFWNERH